MNREVSERRRKVMFCQSLLLRLLWRLTYFSFIVAYLWVVWCFLYVTFLLLLREIRWEFREERIYMVFEVKLNGCLLILPIVCSKLNLRCKNGYTHIDKSICLIPVWKNESYSLLAILAVPRPDKHWILGLNTQIKG